MNYKQIAQWAVGDDTGMSSKFLAACALGDPDLARIAWPHDNDDFGRCYRFALILTDTELDDALQMAAGYDAHWKAIAGHWEQMCDLYCKDEHSTKLYDLMDTLGL